MPLYPYRCTQCGHRFEKIQSFSSEPEKVCPQCGGALERLLTAPGLQFKGAGWYVNDYSSKGSSSSSESASTSADKKSDQKSEPKSGSKAESSTSSSSSAPAAPASSSTPSSSK